MPIEKPSTRPVAMQSTKPKGKVEAGPSTKKNSPADNTMKVAVCTQASGRSIVKNIPRRTTTVPMKNIQ
jgi:hypothetical protein